MGTDFYIFIYDADKFDEQKPKQAEEYRGDDKVEEDTLFGKRVYWEFWCDCNYRPRNAHKREEFLIKTWWLGKL